jgi:hypothetical protein
MRRSGLIFFALLVLAFSLPCYAGDRLGIGVKGGTLGLGVDLTGRITNWFAVRGSVNAIDAKRSYEDTDVDYDADVKLGAYGVLLDLHPFKGNFRLTAGLMKNRNEIDLTAQPTADVDIGGTTYTPAQVGTLKGSVTFKDAAPYFGIGLGDAAKGPGRVKFVLDVGVLMQGSGNVSLASSTGVVSAGDLRQEENDIEDDISNYKFWPVLALGVSFRL